MGFFVFICLNLASLKNLRSKGEWREELIDTTRGSLRQPSFWRAVLHCVTKGLPIPGALFLRTHAKKAVRVMDEICVYKCL